LPEIPQVKLTQGAIISSSASKHETVASDWLVYIIESSDQRLYTGITNNLSKRWRAHCTGKNGAKFFRGRKPRIIRYVETGHDRSSASKREAAIKALTRHGKLSLIANLGSVDYHKEYGLDTGD